MFLCRRSTTAFADRKADARLGLLLVLGTRF